MPKAKSESNENRASLLQPSPYSSSDNLNGIEMQNMELRSRHRQSWLRWTQNSKIASCVWVRRPRYYFIALGVIVVLSILLLLRQHKQVLAVRLHAIQLEKLIPSVQPSQPVPPLQTAPPSQSPETSNHSSTIVHADPSAKP